MLVAGHVPRLALIFAPYDTGKTEMTTALLHTSAVALRISRTNPIHALRYE